MLGAKKKFKLKSWEKKFYNLNHVNSNHINNDANHIDSNHADSNQLVLANFTKIDDSANAPVLNQVLPWYWDSKYAASSTVFTRKPLVYAS